MNLRVPIGFALGLLLSALTRPVLASHIVGGNFEMAYQGTPGNFLLSMRLFFDEANGSRTSLTNQVTAVIFRKSDNEKMQDIVLVQNGRTPVQYTNEACAKARSLKTTDVGYSANLRLNPLLYNDPAGYYIVWERCCRNAAADNILSPGQTGMTFYLEFPALLQNGVDFINSSPDYGIPNGEYICKDDPFKLSFAATDADGDRLVYSMVTPFAGYSSSRTAEPIPRGASTYPPVQWASGYDAQNQITGNPPLQVDAQTGLLSVTASSVGLHVFCVLVEEYRNGQRIGAVRRDFQLLVIDCIKTPPPTPPVYTASTPVVQRYLGVRSLDLCEDGFVELVTTDSSNYSYQWQRDGQNLANATMNKLAVGEPGKYTVVVNYKVGCGRASYSDTTDVIEKPGAPVVLTADGPTTTCADRLPTLSVRIGNFSYVWLRNGDTLATNVPSLKITQSGLYSVKAQSLASDCYYLPSQSVTINSLPESILFRPSKPGICANDTLNLNAKPGAGYQYTWLRDGTPLAGIATSTNPLSVKTSGSYAVKVVDANGCTTQSGTLPLVVNPIPQIVFDSIPLQCGSDRSMVTLKATPAGGLFSGPGVRGETFSPKLANFGNHVLTYTAVNEFLCTNNARRVAVVSQVPRVQLGPDFNLFRGDTASLPAHSSPGVAYRWSPPDGLSDATAYRPTASPDQTTAYTLRGTYPNGCYSEDAITVTVWEKLTVPNGFTPNGDGTNDTWELAGIAEYPNAEIRIFNRWGSEVFASKGYENPFDGRFQSRNLPPATYYYVIRPNEQLPPLKGSVTILQ